MRAKGYSSYRGRSPLKTFLKILLLVVVVLALLGIAANAYLQQYLVVYDGGVRLELPFFTDTEQDAPPSTAVPSSVSTPPAIPTEPVVVVTSTPEPEPEGLHPAALPTQALYDGTARSQIEAAGGDGALFDMKTDSGQLNYVSALPLAEAAGVSSPDASINVAIKALNQEERLYTIARVSCFKDHAVLNGDRNLAVFTNSGYLWTDPDGVRWISPTNEDARQYVTDICVELAQLGFDEILLDNAGYPSEGNLHYIKKGAAYDAEQFSAVTGGFYAQVAAALEEYGVKLSIVTTPEALAGEDSLTGQTPENLALADRLWVRDEAGALVPMDGAQQPEAEPS